MVLKTLVTSRLTLSYAARLDLRSQQSVDDCGHALKLHPGSFDGLSGLAQSYCMMEQNDEAITAAKQAATVDAKYMDDWISLGAARSSTTGYTLGTVARANP